MAAAGRVLLAQGSVSHWFAQAPANLAEWLGPAERRRAERISAATRRRQFVAGRWLMRRLLCAWAPGTAPRDWLLTAADDAPPQVLGGPQPLHLSISHSGDRLACAVSEQAVGIDVEALPPARPRDIDGLLDAVCTPREREPLAHADAPGRAIEFHRLWTTKEAWLKGHGQPVTPGRLAQLEARLAVAADDWVVCSAVSGQQALAVYAAADAVLIEPLGNLAAPAWSRWAVDDLSG